MEIHGDAWSLDLNTNLALLDCLFGGLKLTIYLHNDYGIGFDSRSEFSWLDGRVVKKFIIFGVDMSSSVHIDNKRKDTSILGKDPTQN